MKVIPTRFHAAGQEKDEENPKLRVAGYSRVYASYSQMHGKQYVYGKLQG